VCHVPLQWDGDAELQPTAHTHTTRTIFELSHGCNSLSWVSETCGLESWPAFPFSVSVPSPLARQGIDRRKGLAIPHERAGVFSIAGVWTVGCSTSSFRVCADRPSLPPHVAGAVVPRWVFSSSRSCYKGRGAQQGP